MTTEGRHAVFVLGEGGEKNRVSPWYEHRAGADRALGRLRTGAGEDLLPLDVFPERDPERDPEPQAGRGAEEAAGGGPDVDLGADLDNGYERRPTVPGRQPFAPLGKRLSPEELAALRSGERVLVRLSRLYYPDPLTVFEGEATIHVDDDILTTHDRAWAEYRLPEDLDPYGGLVAEDYYMEVFASGGRP